MNEIELEQNLKDWFKYNKERILNKRNFLNTNQIAKLIKSELKEIHCWRDRKRKLSNSQFIREKSNKTESSENNKVQIDNLEIKAQTEIDKILNNTNLSAGQKVIKLEELSKQIVLESSIKYTKLIKENKDKLKITAENF